MARISLPFQQEYPSWYSGQPGALTNECFQANCKMLFDATRCRRCRAFAVADVELSSANIQSFFSYGRQFSTKASAMHNKYQKQSATTSQLVLCRVVLGRMYDEADVSLDRLKSSLTFHSEVNGKSLYTCRGANLAYPEYLITYQHSKKKVELQSAGDAAEDTGRSVSKMCIICMD